MEIKNVRIRGPIYDLRVNILSFFNFTFLYINCCKDKSQIGILYNLFVTSFYKKYSTYQLLF